MAQYPVPTLPEMLEKGKQALRDKTPDMIENYKAAVPLAQENYDKLPFGGKMSRNYRKGMDRGKERYRVNPEGWANNFEEAAKAN